MRRRMLLLGGCARARAFRVSQRGVERHHNIKRRHDGARGGAPPPWACYALLCARRRRGGGGLLARRRGWEGPEDWVQLDGRSRQRSRRWYVRVWSSLLSAATTFAGLPDRQGQRVERESALKSSKHERKRQASPSPPRDRLFVALCAAARCCTASGRPVAERHIKSWLLASAQPPKDGADR